MSWIFFMFLGWKKFYILSKIWCSVWITIDGVLTVSNSIIQLPSLFLYSFPWLGKNLHYHLSWFYCNVVHKIITIVLYYCDALVPIFVKVGLLYLQWKIMLFTVISVNPLKSECNSYATSQPAIHSKDVTNTFLYLS